MQEIIEHISRLRNKGIKVHLDSSGNNLKIKGELSGLNEGDKSFLQSNKQTIISFFKEKMKDNVQSEIPLTNEKKELYRLSPNQETMWAYEKLTPCTSVYHVYVICPYFLYLFNTDLFYSTIGYLLKKHEILRTLIVEKDGVPYQKIAEHIQPDGLIEQIDLEKSEDPGNDSLKIIQQTLEKPFNLENDPLWKLVLFKYPGQRAQFYLQMHHIISDAATMELLINEILSVYQNMEKGINPVSISTINYKDYSQWIINSVQNNEDLRQFWKKELDGYDSEVRMFTGSTRNESSKKAGHFFSTIPAGLYKQLNEWSVKNQVSLFATFVSAISILLAKRAQVDDFIIGIPVSGRVNKQLEGLMGNMVNTIPLRIKLEAAETAAQLIDKLNEKLLNALKHQSYPLEYILRDINYLHSSGTTPLFDTLVSMPLIDQESQLSRGIDKVHSDNSIYKLSFTIIQNAEEKLQIIFKYRTDYLQEELIKKFQQQLITILKAIVNNSNALTAEIDILSPEERQLLFSFNPIESLYPKEKTLAELFEEQVEKTPLAIAVSCEDRSLSYHELNEESNQLADYLRKEYNIKPDDLVAIKLGRSSSMIIAILAVLKSGGAYVPIDADYPPERINHMLKDSKSILQLDENELEIFYACINEKKKNYSRKNEPVETNSNHLAYVMYTSGSTGLPKGVMIEQKGVVRMVKGMNYISVTESDHFLNVSNFSFDASVFDIFGSLLNGASLTIAGRDQLLDFGQLERLIAGKRISILFVTTALFNSLVDHKLSCLNNLGYLLFGGEQVSLGHVKKFKEQFPGVRLIHLYGPAENTTFSSWYEIKTIAEEAETIPIGSGISNSSCYIFDKWGQLSGMGVVGEIMVGGAGLARGYLNNEELTKSKFIAHPFIKGERLYKTGDLGKWLEGGAIEFIGRKDDQVKIRGFRIELGEVQNALDAHPRIESSLVMVHVSESGEKELVGYYTGEIGAGEVRGYMKSILPVYMVPMYYIRLEKLPLNANGKIDKKSLPAPSESDQEAGAVYVEARNETESKLLELWKEVLSRDRISVKDNFFEIGGHSLNATRITSKIHAQFEIKIDLAKFFKAPTIEELAIEIDNICWLKKTGEQQANRVKILI